MRKINEKYRLDNYIVGENNKFAHYAALEILDSPGEIYNPLLVFGEAGTGKTHLLNAIGRSYKKQNPDMNVVCVTAVEMIEDIIESIRHNTVWKMRDKYIKADILIVDDIQAFDGKEASQEEFFQFFDTVHRNGKQIVLSSNVHPYKLEGLEERLLSRLVWGLVAEVTLPDIETRRMLIKGFALSYDIELDPVVIEYIAKKMNFNMFRQEGFVKALKLYAKTNGISPEKLTVVEVEKLMPSFILDNETRKEKAEVTS